MRTVDSHVAALLRKLQAPDRRTLARKAAVERVRGRGALPVPVTRFIGRRTERAALAQLLAEHRLVTAVGPGGIGKTRLAISVAADLAAERRDGAWFVDLVRITDPAAVVAAVAEAVGVPQQQTASLEAAVVASLATRDGLLVLDNCEHLADAVCACVEPIVASCSGVTVLATSRTRLLLSYERLYTVPGMAVDGDAVALFLARASEATGEELPDPRRLSALCEALDGVALAIELAASRYPTLGLDGLEAGLHERLRLLDVGGSAAAGRHRSIRDTISWSYSLLDPTKQALLRGISVFASLVRRRRRTGHRGTGHRPSRGNRWACTTGRPQPGRRRARCADPLPRAVHHPRLRRGATRAGGRARDGPGPARPVVPRPGSRSWLRHHPTTPGATGSTTSSTTLAPRSSAAPAIPGEPGPRQRSRLSSPASCSSAGGSPRHSSDTSRPQTSTPHRPNEWRCCGGRPV